MLDVGWCERLVQCNPSLVAQAPDQASSEFIPGQLRLSIKKDALHDGARFEKLNWQHLARIYDFFFSNLVFQDHLNNPKTLPRSAREHVERCERPEVLVLNCGPDLQERQRYQADPIHDLARSRHISPSQASAVCGSADQRGRGQLIEYGHQLNTFTLCTICDFLYACVVGSGQCRRRQQIAHNSWRVFVSQAEGDKAAFNPPMTLKTALLALTSVGVAGLVGAGVVPAQAQSGTPAKPPSVIVTKVSPPKNTKIETPPQWVRIQIELTKEQRDQLAKQGVDTSKLDITTYNISQLAGDIAN